MSFSNNIHPYPQANAPMYQPQSFSSYTPLPQPTPPTERSFHTIKAKPLPVRRGWGWKVLVGTHRNNQNYLHGLFGLAKSTADKTLESTVTALLRKNQDRSSNDLVTRVSLIAAAALAVIGLIAGINFFLFIASIIAGASILGAVIHGVVEEEDAYLFNYEVDGIEEQFK